MSRSRVSQVFYLKAYNIPINTFKSVCFNRLKNKFQAILITQTVEGENIKNDRCTHHIAIQNETRVNLYLIKFLFMTLKLHYNQVKLDYIMDILNSVYNELNVENIKCLHFANVLKKLTHDDTNPLYKGFNIDQFR